MIMIMKMMKDIIDEYHGVDVEQKHREEREERQRAEREYKENNFAPVWAKRSAIAICIAYVIIAILMFYGAYQEKDILTGLLTGVLLVFSFVGTILMNIKNRKLQMYGCVIFGIFLIVQSIKSFR